MRILYYLLNNKTGPESNNTPQCALRRRGGKTRVILALIFVLVYVLLFIIIIIIIVCYVILLQQIT